MAIEAERRLSAKELASELGRGIRYVRWMVAKGFVLVGGRTTLARAEAWLEKNPNPCANPKKRRGRRGSRS